MGQMRTQLQRLENGQATLERRQVAMCTYLRIPYIDESLDHSDPDHSDYDNEQHRGGVQIDPIYGLQEEKVVRVRRQPVRDRVSSQVRRPPYIDATQSKKRKTDVLVERADMDLVPAILDPVSDVETMPLVPEEGGAMILPSLNATLNL